MTNAPVVSVCIANYNGLAMIDACIESVLAQDCGFTIEIIVHDDASSDESVNVIRSRYPNIRLIESPDNVGFCIANNRMAAKANGKYLLLLNNDATLYPDALRTLHQTAISSDRPAILGLPQYDHDSGELIDRGCLLDPFFNPVANIDAERREVAMVIGACLWIPKRLWDEMGGLPEWFGSIAEDMYLCCSARLSGYQVRVPLASGYRHRVGQSFGGGKVTPEKMLVTTYRRRALSERNKTFVMVITCPVPFFHLLFLLHLLAFTLEAAILTVMKRDIVLWNVIYQPCLAALWRERKRLGDLRKRTQEERHHRICARQFFSAFDWRPYKFRMLIKYGLPIVRQNSDEA